MKKIIILLLTFMVLTFAGKLHVNYNDGTDSQIFEFESIENLELIDTSAPEGFVYVRGGTFDMGDAVGDQMDNTRPVHEVKLNTFLIGKYETTQKEWTDIMGSNPAIDYGVGENYPVYYISWYEIIKFCNLRSMSEGLTPCYTINNSTDPQDWGEVPLTSADSVWDAVICDWSVNGYRLPSEAEWEYAARGGIHWRDGFLYSGSNSIDEVAWSTGTSSQPVGTKLQNQLGTYDMSGNVHEHCWDWFDGEYYLACYELGVVENSYGPETNTGTRSRRGGGWGFTGVIAYRMNTDPWEKSNPFRGFRLARTKK